MKRFMLAVAVAGALGSLGSAQAECAKAGEYDTVYVRFGNVEITGHQFGNFATGPATACSDGTTGTEATKGLLSIKVDGVEVCRRTDTRVSADPFGFGIGIHAGPGSCGADVSLGNVMWASAKPETVTGAYLPEFEPAAAGAGGANAGVVGFSPTEGWFWLDNGPNIPVPSGQLGWYTRGVRVDLS